jgi:hypothetical protein
MNMPRIDFSQVEDANGYSPLGEGQYLCRLADVEQTKTQYGDEMWKLRFVVDDGPSSGRYIFDNLVFSAAAMKRAKLICSRLGLDVSGEVDLVPSMITGRRCYVTVGIEEYGDKEGNTKARNVVPFAGYERVEVGGPDEDDDPPF